MTQNFAFEELFYYADILGRERPEIHKCLEKAARNPELTLDYIRHFKRLLKNKDFDLSDLPLFGSAPENRPREGIYAGDIMFGNRTSGKLLLPVEAFAEHTLVVGHSGAGKSFLIRMLVPQFAEREISIRIFDSQKEYRSLLKE